MGHPEAARGAAQDRRRAAACRPRRDASSARDERRRLRGCAGRHETGRIGQRAKKPGTTPGLPLLIYRAAVLPRIKFPWPPRLLGRVRAGGLRHRRPGPNFAQTSSRAAGTCLFRPAFFSCSWRFRVATNCVSAQAPA
jgi:hypothetical protein